MKFKLWYWKRFHHTSLYLSVLNFHLFIYRDFNLLILNILIDHMSMCCLGPHSPLLESWTGVLIEARTDPGSTAAEFDELRLAVFCEFAASEALDWLTLCRSEWCFFLHTQQVLSEVHRRVGCLPRQFLHKVFKFTNSCLSATNLALKSAHLAM